MSIREDGWKRAANGTFAPGNRGGPGTKRGTAHTNNKLAKRAIATEITIEEHAKIARVVADKALGGDLEAVRLLWDRLLGRAAQGLYAVTGPDNEPASSPEAVVRALLLANLADRVPPGLAHLVEPVRAALESQEDAAGEQNHR